MATAPARIIDDDAALRACLEQARTLAVVGFKPAAHEAAYRIPLYMQQQGYRVVPVNPKVRSGLGVEAKASLDDVDQPIDIVNVFRAVHNLPPHIDEILRMAPRPQLVWLQLGIRHDASAERLIEAGIAVVQDRCIMVEHRRLVTRGA